MRFRTAPLPPRFRDGGRITAISYWRVSSRGLPCRTNRIAGPVRLSVRWRRFHPVSLASIGSPVQGSPKPYTVDRTYPRPRSSALRPRHSRSSHHPKPPHPRARSAGFRKDRPLKHKPRIARQRLQWRAIRFSVVHPSLSSLVAISLSWPPLTLYSRYNLRHRAGGEFIRSGRKVSSHFLRL